jgi:hypothetical protein
MKNLVTLAFTCFLVLGFTGCSNDNIPPVPEANILDQNAVKASIRNYFSGPSTPTTPPDNVEAAFRQKFPDAVNPEWEVSNNVYEVDFDVNFVEHEAWYDADANLLMYKHDITTAKVPTAVTTQLEIDYLGYRIDEVEKVYKGTIIGYYFDLEKAQTDAKAFYNEDGTFLSIYLWEDTDYKPTNNADTETPPVVNGSTDAEADALIAAYYSSYDQDVMPSQVPAPILTAFTGLFSNARDIDWDTSNEVYKVDFEIGNVDYDAYYKADGALLAYKFDITRSSLPQAVQAGIQREFNGYTIDDADKVVKANSKGYYVEVERGNMEYTAYYTEDGTYVANTFYSSGGTAPGQNGNTEPTPNTPNIPADGDYSNDEIDALLQAYASQREIDIRSSDVPTVIITVFNSQFAAAHDIEWEYAGDVFHVDFELSGMDYEVWYHRDGTLLMYTTETWYSNIPAAVTSAVSAQYAEYKIDDCKYFQKGTLKGYIFEVEHRRTGAELITLFDENGNFLSERVDY